MKNNNKKALANNLTGKWQKKEELSESSEESVSQQGEAESFDNNYGSELEEDDGSIEDISGRIKFDDEDVEGDEISQDDDVVPVKKVKASGGVDSAKDKEV
jgi:hypothetical protein